MGEKYEVKLPVGTAITVEDPKLLHKVADLLCIPIEEAAKLAASAIRVVGLPIAALETYGNRVIRMIENAEAQVPPERQIPPAPSVAGPILENVKYLEEGNPLLRMYERLLARAMDRDRVNEAHPAFSDLIKQLSPDEALVLYTISKEAFTKVDEYESPVFGESLFEKRDYRVVSTWRSPALMFPQHEAMYLRRLESMGLLERRAGLSEPEPVAGSPEQDPRKEIKTYRTWTTTRLSAFGKLFAAACIPDQWDVGKNS
jgi:hypothetical protein